MTIHMASGYYLILQAAMNDPNSPKVHKEVTENVLIGWEEDMEYQSKSFLAKLFNPHLFGGKKPIYKEVTRKKEYLDTDNYEFKVQLNDQTLEKRVIWKKK